MTSSPVLEVEQAEKMDKSSHVISAVASSTGRSSRTGGAAKSKRSQKHLADAEKQKEEELLLQQTMQKEAERMAAEAANKESQMFVMPSDTPLLHYIDDVMQDIKCLPTSLQQTIALAKYVSDRMGGPVACGLSTDWQVDLQKLKEKLDSNVLPLGLITNGFYCHRALLFKLLADRIGLQTSLIRSDYGRAWNEILLLCSDVTPPADGPLLPKSYIIDVMHQPGELLDTCGYDALAYMTSQAWQN